MRHRQSDQDLRAQLDAFNPKRLARNHRSPLLQEDVSGIDNLARTELQDGLSQNVGVKLEVTGFQNTDAGITSNGILQLGQPVRFSLTNTQPDRLLISTENLVLTQTAASALSKLQAYYQTWYEQSTQPDSPEEAPLTDATTPAPAAPAAPAPAL